VLLVAFFLLKILFSPDDIIEFKKHVSGGTDILLFTKITLSVCIIWGKQRDNVIMFINVEYILHIKLAFITLQLSVTLIISIVTLC